MVATFLVTFISIFISSAEHDGVLMLECMSSLVSGTESVMDFPASFVAAVRGVTGGATETVFRVCLRN